MAGLALLLSIMIHCLGSIEGRHLETEKALDGEHNHRTGHYLQDLENASHNHHRWCTVASAATSPVPSQQQVLAGQLHWQATLFGDQLKPLKGWTIVKQ